MSTTVNELSEADLRSLKDGLYEASKSGKRNFTNIYELITCRENIIHAIRKVKSNSGFKTKGVDDVTGQEFLNGDADEMFNRIRQNLEDYKPQDVRRVLIPKANGKTRPLGISTIMDRVIQTAVANIIEPICEAQFFEHSYGFRPQRGIEHVMARFSYLTTKSQRHWVVEGDIKGYFDNIDHKILINKLYKMGIRDKRVLAIIKKMLKAGIRGINTENVIGTPQGSTISTLLANVYLNDFDHWVSKQWDNFETKYKFSRKDHKMSALKQRSNLKQGNLIRYADDWVILTSSEEEAIRWKKSCTKYLKQKLKIELSEEKTKITDLTKDRATFVGIDFLKQPGKNGNFTLRSYPNPERLREKRKKVFEALKEIRKASRRNETDMGIAILKYNAVVRGLNNFYRFCTMYSTLARMEWSMKDARLKTKNKRNGKWTPIKHCSNLIYESKKYGDTNTIAWKLQDTTIGLVKLGVGNYKIPKVKAQWENKYSADGRARMEKATGEKQGTKVRNPFLTLVNLPDLIARNTGTKYTLEYFINRPMVFNIDKYKCRHCKKTLTGDGDVEIHHLNPNLPDDEINKVRNLVTLCKTCHIEEHRIQRESKKKKKKISKTGGSTSKTRRVSKCPEKDILLQLIRTEPYTEIGKRFDVSGNAVKKWAINYGIHEERMFQHKAKGN